MFSMWLDWHSSIGTDILDIGFVSGRISKNDWSDEIFSYFLFGDIAVCFYS
jgi:hypothetical protein